MKKIICFLMIMAVFLTFPAQIFANNDKSIEVLISHSEKDKNFIFGEISQDEISEIKSNILDLIMDTILENDTISPNELVKVINKNYDKRIFKNLDVEVYINDDLFFKQISQKSLEPINKNEIIPRVDPDNQFLDKKEYDIGKSYPIYGRFKGTFITKFYGRLRDPMISRIETTKVTGKDLTVFKQKRINSRHWMNSFFWTKMGAPVAEAHFKMSSTGAISVEIHQ